MKRYLRRLISIAALTAVAAVNLLSVTPAVADSAQWVAMTSSTTADLNGIWGFSGSDIFVVGNGGTILRYDGRTWRPMTSGTTNRLNGVWGITASDVYAVGNSGTILHFDGKTWTAMTSNSTSGLYGIWGSSASNVFAAGLGGTVLKYDGKAWAEVVSGTRADLFGLWGTSGSDVFAVGSAGTVVHYDGRSWAETVTSSRRNLLGAWGSSSNDVFAVGGGGALLHYDGKSWVEMLSGTSSNILAAWGSSGSSIFAIGGSGTAIFYDGKTWSPMVRDTTNDLNSVWGVSSTEVYAVGQSGAILRYMPPGVTSIAPAEGVQGGSHTITINGRNLAGAREVRFGAGIAVNSFSAGLPGQITAYIAIVPGAETGQRDVSVTTAGGTAILAGAFTVKQALPVVVSVSPDRANQETSLNLIVTGANFAGATALSLGDGITVNSFAVPGSTQITANVTVTASAAAGKRGVTVTTPGGTATLPDSFTVRQALPVISSVSPNQGDFGATLDVSIKGKNFNGTGEIKFGGGIAVNRFTVPNPNEILASVTIVSSAGTGPRDISVMTPGGDTTLTGGFTVRQGQPVIASVSPARGNPGETIDVVINGSNLDGATVVSFGSQVTVNRFSNRSQTQVAASITIIGNASPGTRDVSITAGGGTGTLAGGFTVDEGPPGTVFIVLVWVGIGVAVTGLVMVLRILRRRRADNL